jgi:hypothetical protein
MKVEALTLKEVYRRIKEQKEREKSERERKALEEAKTYMFEEKKSFPQKPASQPELVSSIQALKKEDSKLIEDIERMFGEPFISGGLIENWFTRIGVESDTRLGRSVAEKLQTLIRCRELLIQVVNQESQMETARVQNYLKRIDNMIAVATKEKEFETKQKEAKAQAELRVAQVERQRLVELMEIKKLKELLEDDTEEEEKEIKNIIELHGEEKKTEYEVK